MDEHELEEMVTAFKNCIEKLFQVSYGQIMKYNKSNSVALTRSVKDAMLARPIVYSCKIKEDLGDVAGNHPYLVRMEAL